MHFVVTVLCQSFALSACQLQTTMVDWDFVCTLHKHSVGFAKDNVETVFIHSCQVTLLDCSWQQELFGWPFHCIVVVHAVCWIAADCSLCMGDEVAAALGNHCTTRHVIFVTFSLKESMHLAKPNLVALSDPKHLRINLPQQHFLSSVQRNVSD